MTTHSLDQADRAAIVAAGLTKAQQEAVQDELFALRTSVHRVRRQLVDRGVCMTSGMLSPLGLAVRAALNDEGKGVGEQ